MKYGQPIYKKCCFCDSPIEVLPLLEGRHTGSILWSDGFMNSPMMPKQEIIAKCDHCKEVVWLIDLENMVIEADNQAVKNKITRYTALNEQELFAIIETEHYKQLPPELQVYLRVEAWHIGNKERRGKTETQAFSKLERENMIALVALLDLGDPQSRVMKAELQRELGEFNSCIEILDYLFDPQFEPIVAKIKEQAELKNINIIKVFGK